jgi:hypothetical protein
MRSTLLTAALVAPSLLACTDPDVGSPPDLSQTTQALTNTPCATLEEADVTFYVPDTFSGQTFPSPSGAYGYVRDSALTSCAGWLVDVFMTPTSNTNPNKKGQPTQSGKLDVNGLAYDLPSSAAANGFIPTTKNDCERYQILVMEYTWPHTDVGYTYTGGYLTDATWSSGICTQNSNQIVGTMPHPFPSTSGYDRFRYFVSVVERTTYQEAAISLYEPPPE